MKKRTVGLLLVLLSGAVLGSMPELVALCKAQGANNALLLLFRFGALALLTLPAALRGGGLGASLRRHFGVLAFLSLTEGLTPILLYAAYGHLPTGLVTTLHFLYPMVVAVLCFLFFREKLSRAKLLCLALCLCGVFLTVDLTGGRGDAFGVAAALLSALTYGAYIVRLNKAEMRDVPPLRLAFFVGAGCFVVCLFYAAVTGGFSAVPEVTPAGWLCLTAAGILIAAGGALLMILGTRLTDAQTAAVASTSEPLASILLGVLFLHEPMDLRIALGCLLILSAVVLLARQNAREQKQK